ncbi:LrgB family protein [Vibrio metschnikovii]|uniref:LrgB family protein n=4 Tax=Unclassified Bacteria TaxID=49928 RepID=A0AAU6SVK2_UNCXX|nr:MULTISPECIES: LrgB family protein [Vibrio]EKO3557239.1 LrgB family protein [Vibrio metschnikovii]EKO3571821.1 LrgB family protein [Vibrio metschnikovii]EKO3574782.1 LrgB family protein [Vibrio metschnikovii]EKO3579041.1 LrgB family protein [Vibrio metschnikovii]EKO3580938.1 LrgB family protein [Vibrio metschnikovii]
MLHSVSLLGMTCLVLTLVLYYVCKMLYQRKRTIFLMPLLLAPLLLVLIVIGMDIPYPSYMEESRWLLWLLGPATVAFAIPVYDNRLLIRRHWLSLSVGVVVSVIVAVSSTVLLARWFELPELLQRSLAMRSITTPFAVEATRAIGGESDLTALFVVLTGVIGMAVGESILTFLSIRSRFGRGASLGASAHGAGTAKAYQMGNAEGVVSSVVMMIAGMVTVLIAPFLGQLLW